MDEQNPPVDWKQLVDEWAQQYETIRRPPPPARPPAETGDEEVGQ